ncbi:Vesicle transport protein SFT2B [Monoraphidium neglectum]|uniref:Vesicle transport protein n=1 Tax=Monoraphidium neglectum TaxID=145388 RepID=A0A0D2M8D2_9CHLO|nr:Vesicle transport protein SFT2B [Monoraphidium neglectum]KIY99569.1 Vesicle transport protein SFT2B [Monoraphidium neglectum]|eukprot:XP_013898589.1 Vesicle transport protein SFT2B [Monoraphidium neglectum]
MGVWDNLKSKMGMGPPPPPPTLPQQLIQNATAAIEQHTPELTWKQRAIGFGICLGVGLLFSFLSLMFLWTFQITSFAVLYSFGSVLSLMSTMFLMGPCKQMKRMMDHGRWLASIVYLVSIGATLAVAFTVKGLLGGILVIILLVIQFMAMIWPGPAVASDALADRKSRRAKSSLDDPGGYIPASVTENGGAGDHLWNSSRKSLGFGDVSKRLWALAWPLAWMEVLTFTKELIITAFVGRLGALELSALVLAQTLYNVTGNAP